MARNPWLDIPASDYEGHMGPEHADQLAPLRAIFGEVYRSVRPRRLALLGCATGNGLEQVDLAVTLAAVAVDINPEYVEVARARHRALGPALEVCCADVTTCALPAGGFDLVHAALLFEHVEARPLVARMVEWLAPGGTCAVVLQLEGSSAPVAPSPYASVAALAGTMRLVSPDEVGDRFAERGLRASRCWVVPLRGGRRFHACLYRR